MPFLIVEIDGTPDFLQLTASPTTFELDFPLVTERQRDLEPAFRMLAADLALEIIEIRGTGGGRFLDIILDGTVAEAAAVVEEFLVRLFAVDVETPLSFLCHGCAESS